MLAGRCRLACGQIIRGRGALLINHPNKSLAVASESSNKPLKSQSEELDLGVGTDIRIAARFRQNSISPNASPGPSVARPTCFGTNSSLTGDQHCGSNWLASRYADRVITMTSVPKGAVLAKEKHL